MPPKKRAVKRYTRKARKPKMYKRIPMTAPKSKMVKMRYVHMITLDGGIAVPATRIYRLNSLYDPDFTGATGSQPAGFDQWMSLYNKYTVVGARIKITALSTSSTSSSGRALFGVYVRNNATFAPDIQETLVKSRAAWRAISATGGGPALNNVTYNWSARKFFAIPKKDSLVSPDEYSAEAGQNPNETAYAVVFACGSNPSVNVDPVDLIVTIDYITVLSEPKSQSLS